MTPEDALLYNNVLANLLTDRRIFSSDLTTLAEHFQVKAALKKMETDGFVIISSKTTDHSWVAELTPTGEVFRAKGGYVQKLRDELQSKIIADKIERRKNRNDNIKTYATIGSLLLGGLALGRTFWADKKINENRASIQLEKDRLDRFETTTTLADPSKIDTAFSREFLDLMIKHSQKKDSIIKE